MAYTLVVKVSGLCLFVPTKDGRTLWGLMVKAHDHGGHVEEHIPAVLYEENGTRTYKRLDGITNAVGGSPGADMRGAVRAIPGNFSRIHGRRAPASWFNAGGESLFAARVSITGSASVAPQGGAVWEYGGEEVKLPTHIVCTIPMATDDPVVVQTTDGPLTLAATPGGTLTVEFHNVPMDQLPGAPTTFPPPRTGDVPAHFAAYEHFLQLTDGKRPHYVGDAHKAVSFGVNPYACLTLPGCSEGDPDCP